ncbi:MAG: Fe-S cluster assembly protein SufD [Wenzhouxiangellaceae bacterium]
MNAPLAAKLLPDTGPAGDPAAAIRRRAREVLLAQGFPTRKVEAWRYFPLDALNAREFTPSAAPQSASPSAMALPENCSGVLHFIDGRFDASASKLPQGCRLEPSQPDEQALARLDAASATDAFAWLNLACFEQCLRLEIASALPGPLALVHRVGRDFAGTAHPRLVMAVAGGVDAELVEVVQGGGPGLVNAHLELILAEDAGLRMRSSRRSEQTVWLQRCRVEVGRDARFDFAVLDGGGAMARHELEVELLEPGAQESFRGAAVLDGRSLVEYRTTINHRVGPSTSQTTFRMLADDRSCGNFNGRVMIAPDADHSDSMLGTGNLLLGEAARVNIKPELEIYAEEVRASHGATVGQLDEAALFYLRSRGLDLAQATRLLKLAFVRAAFEDLGDTGADRWLLRQLAARLEAGDVD